MPKGTKRAHSSARSGTPKRAKTATKKATPKKRSTSKKATPKKRATPKSRSTPKKRATTKKATPKKRATTKKATPKKRTATKKATPKKRATPKIPSDIPLRVYGAPRCPENEHKPWTRTTKPVPDKSLDRVPSVITKALNRTWREESGSKLLTNEEKIAIKAAEVPGGDFKFVVQTEYGWWYRGMNKLGPYGVTEAQQGKCKGLGVTPWVVGKYKQMNWFKRHRVDITPVAKVNAKMWAQTKMVTIAHSVLKCLPEDERIPFAEVAGHPAVKDAKTILIKAVHKAFGDRKHARDYLNAQCTTNKVMREAVDCATNFVEGAFLGEAC